MFVIALATFLFVLLLGFDHRRARVVARRRVITVANGRTTVSTVGRRWRVGDGVSTVDLCMDGRD